VLDLLFLPAFLLVAFALRAVRQGAHRRHGYLMTAALTVVVLRLILHPRTLQPHQLTAWGAALACAALTLFLGHRALAWREARSHQGHLPRFHRTAGLLTLVGLTLTLGYWLLRARG